MTVCISLATQSLHAAQWTSAIPFGDLDARNILVLDRCELVAKR
jgi:hypothetical protein